MQTELQAPRGEPFTLRLALGAEGGHEVTATHHIRWIRVYYLSDGRESVPIELGSFRFATHESAEHETKTPVCAGDSVHCVLTLHKPGILMVVAWCSLHGFWEREMRVELV